MDPEGTRHEPTTDRIVIEGGTHYRTFITRNRLRSATLNADGSRDLTPLGEQLAAALDAVDGFSFRTDSNRPVITAEGFGVQGKIIHPALWSWDEVEPQVIAAFKRVIGDILGTPVELDVIRLGNGATS